jgi:hypothetical protein
MCTGPNTEAGKQRRAAATRIWWANWDPKARSRYMGAVVQRQVDKMRRIRRGAGAASKRGLAMTLDQNHAQGPLASQPQGVAGAAARLGCSAKRAAESFLQGTAELPITYTGGFEIFI